MLRRILVTVFVVSSTFAFAQSPTNLSKLCNDFIKKSYNRSATISLSVMDASSQELIYSYHPYTSCIPASTQKTLTTIAGLETLGDNKKFKTDIGHSGYVEGNVLKGDLIIKGYGDPTVGSGLAGAMSMDAVLTNISDFIISQNITSIEGNIVGDGSYYDTQLSNGAWMWSDIGNYFAVGPSGLNINQNKYVLTFRKNPNLYQKTTIIGTTPEVEHMTLINEVTSAPSGTGDNAYIYGSAYAPERIVRGTIPAGTGTFKIKGSVPNPPLFFAELVAKKLKAKGVSINGQPIAQANTSYTPLKTIESPTLLEITKVVNKKSNNFLAESVFKAFAKEKCGTSEYLKAAETLTSFYSDKGIDMNTVKIKDGSGLSPMNRISSLTFCNILANTYQNTPVYNSFLQTLPKVGIEGTVRYMLTKSPYKGKIYAKSGSIEGVKCYVGYAKTKSGKTVCFSFLVNNFSSGGRTIRNELAKIMEAIAAL